MNTRIADLKTEVRRKYGEAATRAATGTKASCADGPGGGCGCGVQASKATGAAGSAQATDPVTRDLYDEVTTSSLPEKAVLASLGCGNPTALAELREGEVVLDLGSGGGIDVLLSAKRVGPTGWAYGLDMTDEMLELARRNAAEAGADNVTFLKGDIENIPLPPESVDVIISNCVINLSADKGRVLREAFRVLRPGGRFAVSDVVVRGEIPDEIRRSLEAWVGCVAGALEEEEFETLLREAGFEDPSLEPTRIYEPEDARDILEEMELDADAFAEAVEGRLMSAFVRARKPDEAQARARWPAARASESVGVEAASRGPTCCG
ncbi:MAG: arsenite methyltransferase [Gemmatimonadota bacterium]